MPTETHPNSIRFGGGLASILKRLKAGPRRSASRELNKSPTYLKALRAHI